MSTSITLLSLPPELRYEIYSHLPFFRTSAFILPGIFYATLTHPLARTCRLLRTDITSFARKKSALENEPKLIFKPWDQDHGHALPPPPSEGFGVRSALLLSILEALNTACVADAKWISDGQNGDRFSEPDKDRLRIQTSSAILDDAVSHIQQEISITEPILPEQLTALRIFFETTMIQLRPRRQRLHCSQAQESGTSISALDITPPYSKAEPRFWVPCSKHIPNHAHSSPRTLAHHGRTIPYTPDV